MLLLHLYSFTILKALDCNVNSINYFSTSPYRTQFALKRRKIIINKLQIKVVSKQLNYCTYLNRNINFHEFETIKFNFSQSG